MKKIIKSLIFAITGILLMSQGHAQTIDEGLRHLNAERYIKAGEVFNAIVNTAPTTENYFQLGRYYLSTPNALENLDKAKDAFTKGNSIDKKGDPFNKIGLATVQMAQGDKAGAKLAFAEIIKKARNKNSEILYRIAESYTYRGLPDSNDPAEAVMLIDNALEIKKIDNPMYYVIKAQAYDIRNEGGDLMNALRNAERLNPKDIAAIYSFMAKIWLQGKNYKEAPEMIQKSIAADPEHAPAYYYSSSYNQTYQNWEQAAEDAKKYLEYGDGDCDATLRYIKLAFTGKDFENVLSKLTEIESCNEDPIVYRLSGISKFELGRNEEAIEDLKKYTQLAEDAEIFGLDFGFIGRAYMAIDDEATMESNDALAIENIEKAIAMNDTTFDYYSELGTYFQTKKDYANAAVYLNKAINAKKNPTGEDWFRVGIIEYQLKDWDNADSSFDKVCMAYNGTWAPPYILSARIKTYRNPDDSLYSYHERYQEYLDILGDDGKAQAANKRDVSDALRYLAGREFTVNNDIEAAKMQLEELLKYAPNDQRAIQTLDSINGAQEDEEGEEGVDGEATSEEGADAEIEGEAESGK